jgi:PEP-CTERM/exosortase A-associated glycosyltransferase
MRILHIFDHSIPLHSGYSFRSRAILREQAKRGWETHHLTTPKHYKEGLNPEVVDGLTFYRTPAPKTKIPGFKELAEISAITRALEPLAERIKPQILHAHSPSLNAMAALRVGRKLGLPVIYEIRGTWEDAAVANLTTREGSLKYRLTRRLESHAARSADAVAVICDGLRREFIARGVAPDKIFQVPNAVDPESFPFAQAKNMELAAEHGLLDAEVIGFLGSFYDYEGLDVLIAALPDLVARRPKLKLLLIGGGPREDALKAQIKALGMTPYVVMLGRVPHAQVDQYYTLCDVLVFPRKHTRVTELVTPLKPLEAFTQGKLVAASDVGGHKELIRHGETGFLFRADDPADLARCVAGLFEDRNSWPAIHQAALTYVHAERTWARSVAHYAPVYERLTNR